MEGLLGCVVDIFVDVCRAVVGMFEDVFSDVDIEVED